MLKKAIKPKKIAIGVDRGGTRTRIVLIDSRGSELKRKVHPSGDFRRLPSLIIKTVLSWRLAPDVPAVIATRGAMARKWRKPYLFKKLAGKLNLVDVISDAEAAYLAAHGPRDGALLIAGTGSVVFLKRDGGPFKKIGGDSPPGGDPGSGLWLGNLFLKLAKKPKTGLDRRARAARAQTALKRAQAGDTKALALVRRGQHCLAALLAEAAAAHPGRKPLRVALAGGLMQNVFFRRTFIPLARERLRPVRAEFKQLRYPAELAAAKLALERSCDE